jgi:hypothetical protein
MSSEPVTIQRMPDGRHHVLDAAGKTLGKHNSPFSAARQVHEYFGPVVSGDVQPGMENLEAKSVGKRQSAVMERPKMPRAPKSRPQIDRPQIPRP